MFFSEKLNKRKTNYIIMSSVEKVKVGSKGEILPKKKMREISNIKPGDEVMIEAMPGELRIRKVLTIEEALSLPIISKGTPNQIEKEIIEEIEKQMEENL